MRTVAIISLAGVVALIYGLGVGASEPVGGETAHASLAAYPNAVITLKDPDSRTLYYVESNGRRLVAFDSEGAITWSADVFASTKMPLIRGAEVIRHLRRDADGLKVTCGRSHEVRVDPKTGKTTFRGND